jgi:UDP-glucose 4-epimerase
MGRESSIRESAGLGWLYRDGEGQVFNVGSGQAYSVLDVAQRVSRLVTPEVDIIFDAGRGGDVDKLLADSSRLMAATGWRPYVSLTDGLARTMEWVRAQGNARRSDFLGRFAPFLRR